MKQTRTTPSVLLALIPDGGEVPDTVKVDGIEINGDQLAKLVNVIRGDVVITIQRLHNERLAVSTDLMPTGVWLIFEADGNFNYPPTTIAAMIAAGPEPT